MEPPKRRFGPLPGPPLYFACMKASRLRHAPIWACRTIHLAGNCELSFGKLLIAGVCLGLATPLLAQTSTARNQPSIVVVGERQKNLPEKLDHIMPEVDGTKITVT